MKCLLCKDKIESGVLVNDKDTFCYQCYSKYITWTKEVLDMYKKYFNR